MHRSGGRTAGGLETSESLLAAELPACNRVQVVCSCGRWDRVGRRSIQVCFVQRHERQAHAVCRLIGTFGTATDAAEAYDDEAEALWGSRAELNLSKQPFAIKSAPGWVPSKAQRAAFPEVYTSGISSSEEDWADEASESEVVQPAAAAAAAAATDLPQVGAPAPAASACAGLLAQAPQGCPSHRRQPSS